MGRVFAGLLLAALFILPCVAGPVGAYIAIVAAVAGALVLGTRPALAGALGDPGLWLFPIAFGLIALAFTLTARSPGDLTALVDFGVTLLAIPAYVLLIRFADSRNSVLVSWLALSGALAAMLMGLFEGFVLGTERASGNSSPIFYSDLGLWLGFMSLTGLFAPRARWRALFALGPIFGAAAAIMGATRGAIFVAAALVVVFVVFTLVTSIERRWHHLGAVVLVLLVTAGLATVFFDTDRMLQVPSLLQEMAGAGETTDASVNFRLEFYRGGLAAIGDAPIAGHGWWQRFDAAAPFMDPVAAQQGFGVRGAHLHNDVINFGAGAGLLGIIAYGLLLAAPLAGAWFSPRDTQRTARLYAGSVLTFGFLAMGLTDSMFVYELPKTVFCLSAAVILGFCRDTGPLPPLPLLPQWFDSLLLALRKIPPWTVLVFLLVIPGLVGSLSSVVVVLAALIFAAPALGRPGAWAEVRRDPAMVAFLAAFVALTLVFIVTAHDPADVRYAFNFLALLLAPVVFLMTRETPADDLVTIFTLALIGVVAAAVLSVAAVTFGGLPRAQGLFGGPNLLPRVTIPLGFIALAGAFVVPRRYRLAFYLGPILAVAVAVLAASRGAAIALPPLVVIAGIALALSPRTRRDLLWIGALGVLAVATVWLLAPTESARLLSTGARIFEVLGGSTSSDFATAERQTMLAAGWTAFLNAPLIGYGWANLGTAAALADPAGFSQLAGQVFMFHNDILDFAVAGGVVGIAVYLLLLIAPIAGALAAPRDGFKAIRIYGALVLSVSFAIFGATDMTFGYDLTMTLYACLTALLLGIRPPARR